MQCFCICLDLPSVFLTVWLPYFCYRPFAMEAVSGLWCAAPCNGVEETADSAASGDALGPPCLAASLPSCPALAPDVMVPSCPQSCLPERPDPWFTAPRALGQLFLPKLGQPIGAAVRSRATNETSAPDPGSAPSIWSSQCRGSGGRQRGAHKGLRGPQW